MATRQAPESEVDGDRAARAVITESAAFFELFIPGDPVAKGRPQAKVITPKGGRPFPQFYTPAKTREFEDRVAQMALLKLRACEPDGDLDFTLPIQNCRILASIRFNMRKPKSQTNAHHIVKPDVDNLGKAVLDALVQGRVMGDDNCVTDLMIMKRYADIEHPVGIEIELTCINL